MESAIPEHLRSRRSQATQRPHDWVPGPDAFVARYPQTVTNVVMAYLGVQWDSQDPPLLVTAALAEANALFRTSDRPRHRDRATYVDEAGYTTEIFIAYWDQPDEFDRWFARFRSTWLGEQNESDDAGFFVEIVRPAMPRFETLFSSERAEGVANLAAKFSEPVVEHAYWGGARDRIALSQTDPLDPGDHPLKVSGGSRTVIRGQHNLCLIRSGQDWAETDGEERTMYLDDIEPTLRAGMEFLRNQGLAVGCYANRYLRLVDDAGTPHDKTFGMSWWRSLADLDEWAKSHPTHAAIFSKAMRYLTAMGSNARLRLYHEVTVASADEQYFEYLGCHPRTGLLKAAAAC